MQDLGVDGILIAVGREEKSTEEDAKNDGGDTLRRSVAIIRKKDKSGRPSPLPERAF